jgi:Mg-chelatase subunit ChlD
VTAPDDDAEDRARLLRWRLALGPSAEKASPELAIAKLGASAPALGVTEGGVGELDRALSFVYEDKRASLAASRPYLPAWLTAVRGFFRGEVVAMVQRDAVERRGLTELLFEPETLPLLERNVELVATLVGAKGLVPDHAKDVARAIVREVVDDVRKRLEPEVRVAVRAALRGERGPRARATPRLDFARTVRKNLRTWDQGKRRLAPERLYFEPGAERGARDVVVLVDQSGSMAESVVYASIMAAIFASIDALRTKLVLFDTEIVDATPLLDDPVDVLFAAQLGGGTDIARAIAYAEERLVERPERTLLVLVSDLEEGGDREALAARVAKLVDAHVTVVALLALSDAGRPAYDHDVARALADLGVPCFAATPRSLPGVIERALRGDVAPPREGEPR